MIGYLFGFTAMEEPAEAKKDLRARQPEKPHKA